MTPDWRDALSEAKGLRVLCDEPMAAHTTYKVGGRARAFVMVEDLEALESALSWLASSGIPTLVVGNGSNVLFSDEGFGGAVLCLAKGFDGIELSRSDGASGHVLRVGAAKSITKLIRFVKAERLSGVEFLGGVPGTVGGAVKMNAGTVLGEVKDSLLRAKITTAGGGTRWLEVGELGLSYRHSELPEGAVVVGAEFACSDANDDTFDRLEHVLRYRKETQPLQMPSCGSVFANPPGDHAGRLIEVCGLKGRTIGGAQVSQMHANWIVNLGQATAGDVRGLIDLCVDTVRGRFGIELRHEVQLLGDWGNA